MLLLTMVLVPLKEFPVAFLCFVNYPGLLYLELPALSFAAAVELVPATMEIAEGARGPHTSKDYSTVPDGIDFLPERLIVWEGLGR